jgi:hypothetical protein
MRRRNLRLIVVGIVLIVAAAAFFVFMGRFAPESNDPVGLMRTVGQVSGAVAGIGLVMSIIGMVGKRA